VDPDLKIGVGGCVTQLHGEAIVPKARGADVIVGTHTLSRVPELLERVLAGEGRQVDLNRGADAFGVPPSLVAHGHPVRAYVTVMEGCNHVCSFCVVPRTRGPEVNRPPDDIVAEVQALVDRGYPEVMLLGQTVNAYRHGETGFTDLLRRVSAIEGLQRLRFTTSHPAHMTEDVARAFGELPKVCPYLHLPVQSGSDPILESMRRGYTAAQYRQIVDRLRAHRPGLAVSSDVIVGYPGETEADFQATVDLVDEIDFAGLFVFAYSSRPGTSALRLEDGVSAEEKLRRVQVLNARQQRRQAAKNLDRVGSTEDVLVDTVTDRGLSGRTPDFRIVHFEGPGAWLGQRVSVEVLSAGPNSLVGRPTSIPTDSLTVTSALPIF
jgi:tRNA-2-methylthio-N6-dimethylallyladenosine synthase